MFHRLGHSAVEVKLTESGHVSPSSNTAVAQSIKRQPNLRNFPLSVFWKYWHFEFESKQVIA